MGKPCFVNPTLSKLLCTTATTEKQSSWNALRASCVGSVLTRRSISIESYNKKTTVFVEVNITFSKDEFIEGCIFSTMMDINHKKKSEDLDKPDREVTDS